MTRHGPPTWLLLVGSVGNALMGLVFGSGLNWFIAGAVMAVALINWIDWIDG